MTTIHIAVSDSDLRDLFSLFLTMRGRSPRTAPNLRATFVTLTAGDVDLLIVDWPPDPQAHETLVARCRAVPELAGLPIVAVGVAFDDAWVERALAAGVTSFLAMPFTMRTVGEVVADLLGQPTATTAAHLSGSDAAGLRPLSA